MVHFILILSVVLGVVLGGFFGKNEKLAKDDVILRLEASKTVLDVNAPLAGDVVEYNKKAEEEPTVLNSADPKESWIVKLTNVDEAEFNKLPDYK